jgi:hypothetical protein
MRDQAQITKRMEQARLAARLGDPRRALARRLTTLEPLPLDRPQPVPLDARPGDTRSPAVSAEPCRRCGVRGDLGCAHQSPAVRE